MPIIRPISDLRNNTPEIEEICIKEQKPVFITQNGSGHLVVMSQKLLEKQQALFELYEKLDESEEQSCTQVITFTPNNHEFCFVNILKTAILN